MSGGQATPGGAGRTGRAPGFRLSGREVPVAARPVRAYDPRRAALAHLVRTASSWALRSRSEAVRTPLMVSAAM